MPRIPPLHLVPALLAAAAHAGEITVGPQPFFIVHHLEAVVVAAGSQPIRASGKLWKDFQISTLAPDGTRVSPGDLLVRFDTTGIDLEIEKIRHESAAADQQVATATLDLQHLGEAKALQLGALESSARQAKEDLAAFTATGRKAAEDRARHAIQVASQHLSQQREEFTRLAKIHQPDPAKTVDQPEHHLIARQRDLVAGAEFTHRMEAQDQDRRLKVLIPREAAALAAREAETALLLKQTQESTRRKLDHGNIELAAAKAAAARAKSRLAALEADRASMEIKAPAAGWLIHGKPIGTPGENPPPIATFVPSGSPATLVARISHLTARHLAKDQQTVAKLPGNPAVDLPVAIAHISETPSAADGLHTVRISATWPEGYQPIPGTIIPVRFISHLKPAAISVPNRALAEGPTGWTVEVKLADGKTEHRPVTTGLDSGSATEILSGLEPGQVIIVPAETP